MMRSLQLITFFILISLRLTAQEDTIDQRIILIGDAGALVNGEAPVMRAVKQLVPLDAKTTAVFLGDNLYREGLPDEQDKIYSEKRAVLDSQIVMIQNTKARAYMIPGNHDWENGGANGYGAVIRQQRYVDAAGKGQTRFYPKDGCPGPVEVNLGNNTVLIIMDSQWWLHVSEKPGIESDCPFKTRTEVLTEVEDILTNNSDKLVLFAVHHPFRSNGIHGGYFGLKQHIFPFTDLRPNLYIPLPLLGSIYPISRAVFGTPQDLKHPTYANMVSSFEGLLRQHPNVVVVAGHEHTLQYLTDSSLHYVVSGSGCKHSRVEDSKKSEFTTSSLGFASIEVSKNKNVRLSFYVTAPDSFGLFFTKNILNFSTIKNKTLDSIPATTPVYVYKDSALVPASIQYPPVTGFKKFMLGNNYRPEWTAPVKMKVFNINKEKGGFKIESLGGGNQTKTLNLVDKKGVEWKLRTVDKDPRQAVPHHLRGSIAKDIVQDMISAAHPYGPLVVPSLSEAAGIAHPKPEYFYVPDDPSLGIYQKVFANTVCLLEKKAPTYDGSEARSTAKVFNNMLEENDHVIYQEDVLKARLLDILIADWDRHFDQWRWGITDTGSGKVYYPIPRDRDQAFFYSDGFLLKYAARKKLPFLKGFQHDIPRVNWLGYASKDFDRIFLNSLTAEDWRRNITAFKNELTDSVIIRSVQQLPDTIYKIGGSTIIDKLKSRRELLMKEGMEYYDFISRYVNVIGSNKKEYFRVINSDSGINVQVYAKEPNDTSFLKYERYFNPEVTKEVRLYGLNNNDVFEIEEGVQSKIKIRMIGGRGNDTFNIKGNVPNYIYDLSTDSNPILSSSSTKNLMSPRVEVNNFDYQDFKYQDIQKLPWISAGFNSEDGPLAGIGLWRTTYGFRKEPFSTDTKLLGLYSFISGAYQFRYNGIYTEIVGGNDLMLNATLVNPVLLNFFGLGNETQRAPELDRSFYRVRYKFFSAEALLRKKPFKVLSLAAGPTFYHYWIKPYNNEFRILNNPELVGLDSANIYSIKTYLGGKLAAHVHNLNNEIFPTRGVDWNTEFSYMGGLNDNSRPISRFQSDMSVYASLTEPTNLIAVLRFGGGHIFSKNYEYFQALTLGTNNHLRGYRKNRFSGSSSAYANIELRYKVYDFRSYLIPGSVGLLGFTDIGRVWARGEDSRKWHHTYGGGLYYLPFNLLILSATVGVSPEEVLFNFSIGTKINLTF